MGKPGIVLGFCKQPNALIDIVLGFRARIKPANAL
jgi:hypothetical protein